MAIFELIIFAIKFQHQHVICGNVMLFVLIKNKHVTHP